MLTNIRHEAAFAPPISHLNFMAHPSPTRGIAKGSYELYDPRSQGKGSDSVGEEMMNGTAGSVAPGSPGSVLDYKQVVANLQREVEERKRKEQDLQQVINSLRATQTPSTTSFLDNQYMNPEGSPSSDSVGENVKDAHIKHLQRQVTILQANLYKADGWTQRAASAIKERDQALDELASVKTELTKLQEENQELKRKNEELAQTLRQVMGEQSQGQGPTSQERANLLEDIRNQRMEIKTLKESLTRLDHENRSLKDSSTQGNSQSLGNVACSQELEYLHRVVDTLKNTVLEQRAFLLNMRQPNAVSGSNQPAVFSAPSSVAHLTNGGATKDAITRRNSSSPIVRASDAPAIGQGQSVVYGRPVKTSLPTENLLDHKQRPPRNGSAPELGIERSAAATASGRKFNSREMLEDFIGGDIPNSSYPVHSEAGSEFGNSRPRQEVGSAVKPVPHMMSSNDGYITPVVSSAGSSQRAVIVHQASGDTGRQRSAPSTTVGSNGYVPMLTPQGGQRNKAQSEVLRRNVVEQANLEHPRCKTENLGRNPGMFPQEGRNLPQWNLSSAGNTVPLHTAGGNVVTSLSGFGLTPVSSQQQGYLPLSSAVQAQPETSGRVYGGQEVQNAFVWDENAVQNLLDNNLAATIENLNLNLSATQQQIYHPPSNYNDSSVRVINHDKMGGGRMTVPPPSPHHTTGPTVSGASQQDLYVNVSGGKGPGTGDTSSSADLDPTRPRLNSDRLCPVCNRDYSQVSMEDFQTHVFECFDDENAPETMKPQPAPEKCCPMCDAKFGPSTTQAEYEKHVHSHFAEEVPEEHFEILQP